MGDLSMIGKNFGTNRILYTVFEKSDGSIEIHVFTDYQALREIISNHTTDGRYFVIIQKKYANDVHASKKWLAKIVSEYRDKFINNKVYFILKEGRKKKKNS